MIRVIGCLLSVLMIVTACSGENAQKATARLTEKTVEIGKGALSGIEQGIEKGRKSADSPDHAIIVTNYADLEKALTVEVLNVETVTDNTSTEPFSRITLGLGNVAHVPVRVSGFNLTGIVLAVDKDGYTAPLSQKSEFEHAADTTVPPNAKIKVAFEFKVKSSELVSIRLFQHDFPVKK